MNFWIHSPANLIDWITTIICWLLFIIIVFLLYRRNKEELSFWRGLIITFIGLFTFDFTISVSGERMLLPLLPLGVWILYGILRSRNNHMGWQRYRLFAWVGFMVSFLFFFTSLLGSFMHNQVYVKDELSTYLATLNNPELIETHPSAKEDTLKNNIRSIIPSFNEREFNSIAWYNDTERGTDREDIQELFPYLLKGAQPQLGSGIKSMVYIKRDGKGVFVVSNNGEQHYFESNISLFKEGP